VSRTVVGHSFRNENWPSLVAWSISLSANGGQATRRGRRSRRSAGTLSETPQFAASQ
jgi:hypothetical protein